MIHVEKTLRIEYVALPDDLKKSIKDMHSFRNDVSLPLSLDLPSAILLSSDEVIEQYIIQDWEVTEEEIEKQGLERLLNSDGYDGLIYRILRLNPDFRTQFDEAIIDICW